MPESTSPECSQPPTGWRCTRGAGHDGPCAAIPKAEIADATLLEFWRAVQGPYAELNGPLIRYAGKVAEHVLEQTTFPTPSAAPERRELVERIEQAIADPTGDAIQLSKKSARQLVAALAQCTALREDKMEAERQIGALHEENARLRRVASALEESMNPQDAADALQRAGLSDAPEGT